MLFDKYQTELILFLRFSEVKTYNIPDLVNRIKSEAFYPCVMLDEVIIPDNVRYIEHGAFYHTNLTSVTVEEGNFNYASEKFGVPYNKDFTELLFYHP